MMLEELQRRNYSEETIRHYICFVEQYARFFGKSPEKLGLEHLRTYQAHLLKTRMLYPRVRTKLPGILSKEEVARIINSSGTLFRRTRASRSTSPLSL
jgi:hypothetical protein